MKYVYSMLKLFGERYIFCDAEQALKDMADRDEFVAAYAAIMDYVRAKGGEEDTGHEKIF